jgi:hypothetical protein
MRAGVGPRSDEGASLSSSPYGFAGDEMKPKVGRVCGGTGDDMGAAMTRSERAAHA